MTVQSNNKQLKLFNQLFVLSFERLGENNVKKYHRDFFHIIMYQTLK